MRIDSLHLVSFGKFKDRKIELASGLNVIFGPNEAGKSTVERFVFGMLYGFAVPGRRRRDLREESENYRPWEGDAYKGRIVFTLDDGRRIRVEREFDPHDVRVYDDVTGQALDFPIDKRREPLFAQSLLGISGPEFEGTVCIGQMQTTAIKNEDKKKSATEIAEHLASALTGGEGDSAAEADAMLKARENEIGSERAPTKPLAQNTKKLKEVRERLGRAVHEREANLGREANLRELQGKLAALRAREAELERLIQSAERAELRDVVNRVSMHVERAADLGEKARLFGERLEPLAALGQIPREEGHSVRARVDAYEDRKRVEEKRAADREACEREIENLERELQALGIEGEPAEIEARVGDLQNGITQAQMEIATRASAAPSPASNVSTVVWAVAAVLALAAGVGLGAALTPYGYVAAALVVPFVVLAALAGRAARAAGEKRSAHEAQTARMRQDVEGKQAELAKLQQEHGCAGAGELRRKLSAVVKKRHSLETARKVRRALEESEGEPAESILRSLLSTLRKAASCSERIAAAVESGRVGQSDVEEFTGLYRVFIDTSNGLARARGDADEAWKLAEENARALGSVKVEWAGALEEACASRNLERARAAAKAGRKALESESAGPPEETWRSASELRSEREKVTTEVLRITGETRELAGKIEEAYADLPDLAKLGREKLEIEEKIAGLSLQLRAIGRAREAIGRLAEEMHRDFAPRLADSVGPIVASLTGGRYASVRIGDALELTAEVPGTGELVPVEKLSAGTLDQFYFALRIGAALELAAGGEKPPIICDESLVQYDDARVLACMKHLHGLGAEYQVLLLTCHERERRAALDLGANVVPL